jgi:hypothetical protein
MATAPVSTKSASALASQLQERGYRAEVFPADPPQTRVDAVNDRHDRHDRYPATSVWEPYENDGWEWGPNFEHHASANISVGELADRVLATLKPRD